MFEKLLKQYNVEAISAHRQGKHLKFLSISKKDFKNLDLQTRSIQPEVFYDLDKPRIFGLRILRTEDLEPGEFIFH